jgi:hypothetical protein
LPIADTIPLDIEAASPAARTAPPDIETVQPIAAIAPQEQLYQLQIQLHQIYEQLCL